MKPYIMLNTKVIIAAESLRETSLEILWKISGTIKTSSKLQVEKKYANNVLIPNFEDWVHILERVI